ncbi:MAG: signal recognition particle protein [Planctomycetota bacterium]|nr:signal recognition particle protein [Planctomycetota bacterium]
MFDSIADSLQNIFRKLGIRGKLTEKNIQEGLREVRVALLQADVNYKVVKDFIDRVTIRAVGTEVIRSIQPAQQIIKIVNDELVSLMGPVDHKIPTNPKGPTVVMMAGLQGSGKTTTCAKLANFARGKGFMPLLVAADIQRPAAVKQLQILGEQLGMPVYAEEKGTRPAKICERAVAHAIQNNRNLVILDTAGRLHIDKALMDELKDIVEKTVPQQVFLVSDAMTGQDAINSAKEFNEQLSLDGIILTKLDGDARGGAALSIKAVTGKPIKYIGVGEKIEQFEEFHPERMASRILGMGDIVSLVEKAQQTIDIEQAKKIEEKLRKQELNFQDFLDQFQQMKKMGPLKELIGMIPGIGRMVKDVDENEFKRVEAIILSMTKDERQHPEIIDGSRRNRIARGSGTSVPEINSLIKQFREMRKMMKGMGKFQKLFGGKIPGGLGQLGQLGKPE